MGLPIVLPPLRDRGGDVLILARHFIEEFCKENKLEVKKLSEGAKKKLLDHPFPGNVRELRSVLQLAMTISDTDKITDADIRFNSEELLEDQFTEGITLRQYDIRIVKHYLKKHNNNVRKVAGILDIGTATIYRMLKEEE